MATPRIINGLSIAMQSALATAKVITAVTKAAPGVVTSTAHGNANGDYLLMTTNMSQLGNRVIRVAATTANTYEMLGDGGATDIDTTLYDTFSSGSSQVITFGVSISGSTAVEFSGGDWEFADTSTVQQRIKTQMPTVASPVSIKLTQLWDVSDTALVSLKALSTTSAARAFLISFPDGQRIAFYGYVGATLALAGSVNQVATTPVVITALGPLSVFAS